MEFQMITECYYCTWIICVELWCNYNINEKLKFYKRITTNMVGAQYANENKVIFAHGLAWNYGKKCKFEWKHK